MAVSPGESIEDDASFEDDAGAIRIGEGRRLAAGDVGPILGQFPSRIVSLLAPQGAGKTSLVAGLYELFLEGHAEPYSFAGSGTMLDFERISHLSRAASGLFEADMERTTRGEGLGYYHLAIRREDKPVNLLIGDRPGETVSLAAGGAHHAASLSELRSASTIAYLVDGELLADTGRRALPGPQAMTVLESIVTAGLAKERPALALILTKADLVGAAIGAEQRFSTLVEALKRRFEGKFGKIGSFETAANPTTASDAFPRGYGLHAVLDFLLEDFREPAGCSSRVPAPVRSFEIQGQAKQVTT